MNPAALLALMRLVSPSLPVGAYAYSQGLEWAVEAGAVRDEASLEAWLRGVLDHSLATLDLPLLARMHAARTAGEHALAAQLDRELMAWRDCAEARLEERQTAHALARVLTEAGLAEAGEAARQGVATFAGLFALACAAWGVPARECLLGFGWSWSENQVLAGVKLVPLGQSAGQRVLSGLSQAIPPAVERAMKKDTQLSGSTPGRSMAQMRHESQDVRLFRS